MKKILLLVMALVAGAYSLQAEEFITSTFSDTADGTKSATAFVPKGGGFAHITDLAYRLDSGLTTGTVDVRRGEREIAISSATSGTGSVLWFDNDPTATAVGEYVIFWDDSAAAYFLYKCTATAATSITIIETAPITTTSDKVYPCSATIRRHATAVVSNSLGSCDIWLPSDMPTALTLDGNTTSCRISVNGNRIR
jgi:hypothetical protein